MREGLVVASVGANFFIWAISPVSATIFVNAASWSYWVTTFCFFVTGSAMLVSLLLGCVSLLWSLEQRVGWGGGR